MPSNVTWPQRMTLESLNKTLEQEYERAAPQQVFARQPRSTRIETQPSSTLNNYTDPFFDADEQRRRSKEAVAALPKELVQKLRYRVLKEHMVLFQAQDKREFSELTDAEIEEKLRLFEKQNEDHLDDLILEQLRKEKRERAKQEEKKEAAARTDLMATLSPDDGGMQGVAGPRAHADHGAPALMESSNPARTPTTRTSQTTKETEKRLFHHHHFQLLHFFHNGN
ncbi:hypothetical protein HDK77DRAFT_495587 [Phyllosticta capitalensis]